MHDNARHPIFKKAFYVLKNSNYLAVVRSRPKPNTVKKLKMGANYFSLEFCSTTNDKVADQKEVSCSENA